jgi:hypothetical protein
MVGEGATPPTECCQRTDFYVEVVLYKATVEEAKCNSDILLYYFVLIDLPFDNDGRLR